MLFGDPPDVVREVSREEADRIAGFLGIQPLPTESEAILLTDEADSKLN
jgi:hypothetical protein